MTAAGRPTWTAASPIRPRVGVQKFTSRDPRQAPVETELDAAKTVAAPGDSDGDTEQREQRHEHAPHDVVADPESREVINRENDVRTHGRARASGPGLAAAIAPTGRRAPTMLGSNDPPSRAPRQHQGLSVHAVPAAAARQAPRRSAHLAAGAGIAPSGAGRRGRARSTPRCWRCGRTISTRCRCSASSSSARGDLAAALRLVGAAMQLRPNSPQVLFNHGLVLNAMNRHEEALASFDEAIKHKGRFAEALNNRGSVLIALGALRGGARQLQARDRASSPTMRRRSTTRATRCRLLDRYDEALKSYDRAIALRPELRQGALQPRRGAGRARPAGRCARRLRPRAGDPARISPRRCSTAAARCARSSASTRRCRRLDAAAGGASGLCRSALHARHADGRLQPRRPRRSRATRRRLRSSPTTARRAGRRAWRRCRSSTPRRAEIDRQRAEYERRLRALCADYDAGRIAARHVQGPRHGAAVLPRLPGPQRPRPAEPVRRRSPRGSWPTGITARRSSRRRRRRANRFASASSAASSISIRSGRSASRAGSASSTRSASRCSAITPATKQDAETAVARQHCHRFVQGPHSAERWRQDHPGRPAACADLSGNRHEPRGGGAGGAAPCAGAMQLHRPSADQRLSRPSTVSSAAN